MADLPIVVIVSAAPVTLQSPGPALEFETQELDCRWYASDENLSIILARDHPSVIVSIGKLADFVRLQKAPYEVKRRWLHFSEGASPQAIGQATFNCYIRNLFQRSEGAPPLVSVFTPTYRTGELVHRPYQSLLRQTYNNWEWVVVDDSDDDGATLELLEALARRDERIALYKSPRRSGIIGEIKRRACMLARGEILVELDHDDELTPDALDKIVKTFAKYPQAGFAYSDWTEVFEESGECVNYGAHWAYGYGSYRTEEYFGKTLLVANTPPLNPKTIRHIVGVPNHLRAWRRSTYLEIGGHNPAIHVADDYELLIRTFLHTKMAHIPHLGYIQYMRGGSNTQDVRRKEIQRLVRYFRDYYDEQIHERLQRLRIDDYVWDKATGRSVPQLEWVPSPAHEPQCNITVEL